MKKRSTDHRKLCLVLLSLENVRISFKTVQRTLQDGEIYSCNFAKKAFITTKNCRENKLCKEISELDLKIIENYLYCDESMFNWFLHNGI